jgi:hypothetical protein
MYIRQEDTKSAMEVCRNSWCCDLFDGKDSHFITHNTTDWCEKGVTMM